MAKRSSSDQTPSKDGYAQFAEEFSTDSVRSPEMSDPQGQDGFRTSYDRWRAACEKRS